MKHGGLAETDDRNIDSTLALDQPRLLEMTDDEGVVTGFFRGQGVADGSIGAAKLGDGMEIPVGRHEAHDIERHASRCYLREACAETIHVWRLFGGIDEALIPDTYRLILPSAHRFPSKRHFPHLNQPGGFMLETRMNDMTPLARQPSPPLFDPFDPAFIADPYPFYHRLRETAPVFKTPQGFWLLTRYEDVAFAAARQALRQGLRRQHHAPLRRATGMNEPAIANLGRTMLVLDPPDHTRLRGLVTKAFTARRVADMRPAHPRSWSTSSSTGSPTRARWT